MQLADAERDFQLLHAYRELWVSGDKATPFLFLPVAQVAAAKPLVDELAKPFVAEERGKRSSQRYCFRHRRTSELRRQVDQRLPLGPPTDPYLPTKGIRLV